MMKGVKNETFDRPKVREAFRQIDAIMQVQQEKHLEEMMSTPPIKLTRPVSYAEAMVSARERLRERDHAAPGDNITQQLVADGLMPENAARKREALHFDNEDVAANEGRWQAMMELSGVAPSRDEVVDDAPEITVIGMIMKVRHNEEEDSVLVQLCSPHNPQEHRLWVHVKRSTMKALLKADAPDDIPEGVLENFSKDWMRSVGYALGCPFHVTGPLYTDAEKPLCLSLRKTPIYISATP